MRALRGERGIAPALLVVVIAWALAAVLMLTGTILAAQRIDERVGSIVGSTSQIDGDLDAVRLAGETGRISADIRTAAKPLAGELDQVIVAARGIDGTAGSILDNAGSINRKVVAINATAGAINSNVRAINANADSINAKVASIEARADGIESTAGGIERNARSINGRVGSIDASVDSIDGRLGGTLAETRTIDPGVAGINIRATGRDDPPRVGRASRSVAANLNPIRDDFADILDVVGQPSLDRGHDQRRGARSIHGHGNSIECQLQRAGLQAMPPTRNRCMR